MVLGKVKLSLCLIKYHAMKTYGRMEVQLHASLTSTLDGGKWSASQPGSFTPGEKTPVPNGYESGSDSEPVWTR
jgi:hypothetical protein